MPVIVIALFLFLSQISHSEEITLHDLQGEWLNKEYYETLIATKSPQRAVQGVLYTSFSIVPKKEHHSWLQIFNFHDGLIFTITGLQQEPDHNTYRILFHDKQESGRDTYNDRFYVRDSKPVTEIDWIFTSSYDKQGKEQRITFIRAEPDIQRFVNSKTLAGTYRDRNGRLFVFRENCVVQWPDTTFTYNVGLDYIFAACSNFWLYNEENKYTATMWYAFEWKDNKLNIYTTHFNEDVSERIERDEKPLFVLTPR